MGIRENIVELRKRYDITQEELAKIAGVSRGAVSQWEGGFSEPRMGSIQRIADHYGLKKSNLIEDGGMNFGSDLPHGAKIPNSEPKPAYAPLLGRVHAGAAQEPDILDEKIPVPYEVRERHPDAYFLQVEGNCMSKVYPEGCYILIDPSRAPQNGSVAVVSIDGSDYVMRRMYRGASTLVLSPESWDEGYEDIVITSSDEHSVEFHGTVVWFQPSEEME
ncbi:MAG TPA: helix-turn-helix domain-containing protein [Candidatus Limicola stercorigallinarum]|nr:helix-turn-helix domain-containing protein [Candidatus Limicola stercorigallinarum]